MESQVSILSYQLFRYLSMPSFKTFFLICFLSFLLYILNIKHLIEWWTIFTLCWIIKLKFLFFTTAFFSGIMKHFHFCHMEVNSAKIFSYVVKTDLHWILTVRNLFYHFLYKLCSFTIFYFWKFLWSFFVS